MNELAGSNPNNFRKIDGDFRDLASSAERDAVIRLMGAADLGDVSDPPLVQALTLRRN
jgi:hypothetical protein